MEGTHEGEAGKSRDLLGSGVHGVQWEQIDFEA